MTISWTSQVTHTAALLTPTGFHRLATYTTSADSATIVAVGMEFDPASSTPQEPKSRQILGNYTDAIEARVVCEAYCRNELPYPTEAQAPTEAKPAEAKPEVDDPPPASGAAS